LQQNPRKKGQEVSKVKATPWWEDRPFHRATSSPDIEIDEFPKTSHYIN
jgi:hypothetical protein